MWLPLVGGAPLAGEALGFGEGVMLSAARS